MTQDRLLKLAAHLRTVAPETFDLADWSCGSAACAVGHACMMPEFEAEGLTLTRYLLGLAAPAFGQYSGWPAVRAFFCLTWDQAQELFAGHCYPAGLDGANHVADRIEEFVRGEA